MLSFPEVAVLDGNAAALGVPTETLMENAGRAVADEAGRRAASGTILVVCGRGNNGGDGIAAARVLAERRRDVRILLAEPHTVYRGLAASMLERLPPAMRIEESATIGPDGCSARCREAALVVDALLGVGVSGALREPYRSLVRAMNASGAPVLSVDVPSGLGSDVAVRPEATVTFHATKAGMTRANSGEILVRPIGIPEKAETHTGPGELSLYPIPRRDRHKGHGGYVLVIAGGPYTGAPYLCARAAMRVGADLSLVLTPEPAYAVVASYSPEIVARPTKGRVLDLGPAANRKAFDEFLEKSDAVVLGPGLGTDAKTKRACLAVVKAARKSDVALVVDADAFPAVARKDGLFGERTILTPHAGEFRILTGEELPSDPEKRARSVQATASRLGCTILAKGMVDVISDGERVKWNEKGYVPSMSHGGTGDVLAGLCGGLLSMKMRAFDAARVAAYVNGKAGEIVWRRSNFGLLASEVIDAVPEVLRPVAERAEK
ncbi:MAG: NAD(P)H-hydrate dehydratase [Methanobacteriota archaeon]